MQSTVVEKPYVFVPPDRGTFWYRLIRFTNLHGRYLRKNEGVVAHEIRGVEKLCQSLEAGHGIMLAPNHCRLADPLLFGYLTGAANCLNYSMASWHLFNQSRLMSWVLPRAGAFSVNRDGIDRKAINTAIEILAEAERPLVIFPEGATSRTNDRLHALLDGVAFIARTAAKKREKTVEAGKVVVHPVAIKYLFHGDIVAVVDDVLTDIEHRLTWRAQRELSLLERIVKVGSALLGLKEHEYFGSSKSGNLGERLIELTNRLLHPLEVEWLGGPQEGSVVPRVKSVRMKVMPEMVKGEIDEMERTRRWAQLSDLDLAQSLSCYLPDYLVERFTADRILETVERFEEDIMDRVRVHGKLKAIIQVGDAIEVSPKRDRSTESDPLMTRIEDDLQGMLDVLAGESKLLDHATPAQVDPKTLDR
ncbi:MAG: 1-acyl-sn-glycerol-3-phosphate acyltransferase [Pirellulaceae bacterium]|nr:1-acyl-sn-glycerol-3-phosphate acyltransferase [Pirellulaceae bacterium]